MPLRDRTGPFGLGPRSGRGRGGCSAEFGYRNYFRGRQGWLLGIAVPLVIAVVRDFLNPSGIFSRIIQQFLMSRRSR